MSMKNREKVKIEEGNEFVRRTIVGGRPLKRKKIKINIPAGIEKVLYRAAIDIDFQKTLFEDRMRAVESQGMKLSDSESMILKSVPDDTLRLMISRIQPKKHGKRRFMKAVAAAVVTLATGTAGVACDDDSPPPSDVTDEVYPDIVGDTSDIPPDIPLDIPADIPQDVIGDTADVPDSEDAADGAENDAEEDAEEEEI